MGKFLASDQAKGFYESGFHQRRGSRWNGPGTLSRAFVQGYVALRILERTSNELYSQVNLDRLVLCYSLAMVSRWADLRTGQIVLTDGVERAKGSMVTIALANMFAFGIHDLSAAEIQAVTCWNKSKTTMIEDHEPFTPLWWIMNQTFEFIQTCGEA